MQKKEFIFLFSSEQEKNKNFVFAFPSEQKKYRTYPLLLFIFSLILVLASKAKADYYLKDSEILKPVTPQAILSLSYNDGILCFINNQLAINALEENHSAKYWNRKIDVYKYLKNGLNLIACQISNGDGNKGAGVGEFDAELIVNNEMIIPKGNEIGANQAGCATSTPWRYYGKGGSILRPPKDLDGDFWYQTGYSDSNWNFGYAPFGNDKKKCTKGILTKAPDDVWFRKWFNVVDLDLYKNDFKNASAESSCRQTPYYPAPILIGLGENPQVDMSKIYLTKFQRPLITGLVKYNSRVKIYINEKFNGEAKVQNGKKSGTSNFYYYPALKHGRYTYFAVAQNKLTDETSFPSKLITFDIK